MFFNWNFGRILKRLLSDDVFDDLYQKVRHRMMQEIMAEIKSMIASHMESQPLRGYLAGLEDQAQARIIQDCKREAVVLMAESKSEVEKVAQRHMDRLAARLEQSFEASEQLVEKEISDQLTAAKTPYTTSARQAQHQIEELAARLGEITPIQILENTAIRPTHLQYRLKMMVRDGLLSKVKRGVYVKSQSEPEG